MKYVMWGIWILWMGFLLYAMSLFIILIAAVIIFFLAFIYHGVVLQFHKLWIRMLGTAVVLVISLICILYSIAILMMFTGLTHWESCTYQNLVTRQFEIRKDTDLPSWYWIPQADCYPYMPRVR